MMSLTRRGGSFLTSLLLLKNPAAVKQQQHFPVPRMLETSSSCSSADVASSRSPERPAAAVHLIVLVHGWMGNPDELSVLQQFLEQQALQVQQQQQRDHTILVHSATCNHGQTHDGIAAGGRRLALEINEWVATVMASLSDDSDSHTTTTTTTTRMTLSLVGNSLGGLYARYALSEIQWQPQQPPPPHPPLQRVLPLQPAVFVTTVTPHLGVAAPHTYVTLPRLAEYGIATILQETGRDLFRVTPVLEQMTVQPQFVQPLRQFRRRIALANAHNTDFQVPCSTAAFLMTQGPPPIPPQQQEQQTNMENTTTTTPTTLSSMHYRLREGAASLLPHAILAVETRAAVDEDDDTAACSPDEKATTTTDPTPSPLSSDELAVRLDSLGWTKIFFDVRSHLPSMNPLTVLLRGVVSNNNNNNQVTETDTSHGDEDNNDKDRDNNNNNNNDILPEDTADQVTSQQLWEALGSDFVPRDGRLMVPLGHQVLVANAKNERYATWTQGGRVVMEELASWLVQEIIATTTTTSTSASVMDTMNPKGDGEEEKQSNRSS